MRLRYFTMRFGSEYVKVVASDIFVAIKWAVEHNEGLKVEDLDYVNGEDVATAEE